MDRDESATRKALQTRLAALEARLRASPDDVDARAVNEVLRLGRLLEISELATPARRTRWPFVGAALLTVVIGSTLAVESTNETEIELAVVATELAFVLDADQRLLSNWPIAELGIAGASKIELGAGDSARKFADMLRLKPIAQASGSGQMRIDQIEAGSGTHVRIRRDGEAGRYRLTLSHAPVSLRVDVAGAIEVARPGSKTLVEQHSKPLPIQVETKEGPLDLILVLPGKAVETTPELAVSGLSLQRLEVLEDDHATRIRYPSTVLSGQLYLDSLDGRRNDLRVGERLRFSSSIGTLHRLRLESESLASRFHGVVEEMLTGSDKAPRSLMPTWLQWLMARQTLFLIWGATLYVLGLVAALVSWLGLDA